MKNLLANDKFFTLINQAYFGKNYSERQYYFLELYKKYQKEIICLVSLYYNFTPYSKNYLSFLREHTIFHSKYMNFWDFVREAVYLLEIGDYKELLQLNKQVSNKFIFTLKYFLKGAFLNVNEDFVLNLIPKIYTKEELYSILNINKKIKVEEFKPIFGGKIKSLYFPFIYFKKPKGIYEFCIFVKDLHKNYLSIRNKKLQNFLASQIKYPYYLLGFLYDKQHKVIVPLFFTKNNVVGENILKEKNFDLTNLSFYPTIKKDKVFSVKTPSIKKFNFEYEVKNNAKLFLKNHLILNKKGLFFLKFKEKVTYVKVADYYFENFIVKGVILENNIVIKTKVTDDIIQNGIKNLYIKRKDYYYNDEIFYSVYEDFEIGELRKCVCCSSFFKKSIHNDLCYNCYKYFYNIAKWSIKEEFIIEVPFIKNRFVTSVEKYEILGLVKSKQAVMRRNFELLPKGYQFVLPFINP